MYIPYLTGMGCRVSCDDMLRWPFLSNQHPGEETCGHGSKSNIPIPTKIGSKMGGEFA